MKKLIFISMSILFLSACESMDSNEPYGDLYDREVMDTEAITLEEQHRLEMSADEAIGYPEEQ